MKISDAYIFSTMKKIFLIVSLFFIQETTNGQVNYKVIEIAELDCKYSENYFDLYGAELVLDQTECEKRGIEFDDMVQYTRKGYGKKVPVEERQADVTVLDRYGNAAVVKAVARDWVDFLHVGKVNGEWKIINVLWEMKPREAEKKESGD